MASYVHNAISNEECYNNDFSGARYDANKAEINNVNRHDKIVMLSLVKEKAYSPA